MLFTQMAMATREEFLSPAGEVIMYMRAMAIYPAPSNNPHCHNIFHQIQ